MNETLRNLQIIREDENPEEFFQIQNEKYPISLFEELLEIMETCLEDHLPLIFKFFFFHLFRICRQQNIEKNNILSNFFFKSLIQKINQENTLMNLENQKNQSSEDELKNSIRLLLKLNQFLEKNSEAFQRVENSLTNLSSNFLSSFMKEVQHQSIDEKAFVKKTDLGHPLLQVQKSQQNQSDDQLNNFQSCVVDMNAERRYSVNADFRLLFKKERSKQKFKDIEFSQEHRRVSLLSKDLSFASFKQENQMSVMSVGVPQKSVHAYYKDCSFHNEALCVSFDDLSFLLELYSKNGKDTTSLSIFLSTFTKKLSAKQHQQELNEMI